MTANPSLSGDGLPDETTPAVPLLLYLFRHGETAWTLSGQYTGRTDIPLTPRGEDAARELGARIRDIPFARVLTSPLLRARQTCELARLATPSEIEPDLTEWAYGDDEGRFPAVILKARPGWSLFRDGAPHGETPAQIGERADRLLSKLRLMAGNIALFSHGHFGRVLAVRWIGLAAGQAQHLLLDTASVSVLCYDHDLTDAPAIALWNSAARHPLDSHLRPPIAKRTSLQQTTIERRENERGRERYRAIDLGRLWRHPANIYLPSTRSGSSDERLVARAEKDMP
jgi:broad specificity phosphatase PhoE